MMEPSRKGLRKGKGDIGASKAPGRLRWENSRLGPGKPTGSTHKSLITDKAKHQAVSFRVGPIPPDILVDNDKSDLTLSKLP